MTLERPRFTTTKLTEGYDMGEVDDAIDRIFAALDGSAPALTPADVQTLRFTPVRLRQGYTIGEVDDWLDLAAAELAAPRAGTSEPGATGTPDPTQPAYAPTTSAAITEVGAGSSRVLVGIVVLVVLVVLAYAFLA